MLGNVIRPSFAKLNPVGKYAYREPSMQVDHLVVGCVRQ